MNTKQTKQTVQSKALSNNEPEMSVSDRRLFDLRWQRSQNDLMDPLTRIYGQHPRFADMTADLKQMLLSRWAERPADLKDLDLQRDLKPDWFQSEQMVGYVFYIDRFSGKLIKVLDHLDHLTALGANYIHFMPCLEPRPGDSDGGYSVKNYRAINPALGTMEDLEKVTSALRAKDMSVCIDLVLNHTAKEHEWAEKAKKGDKKYQDYYWMFDTDIVPKQYEQSLVEIFPANAPGNCAPCWTAPPRTTRKSCARRCWATPAGLPRSTTPTPTRSSPPTGARAAIPTRI